MGSLPSLPAAAEDEGRAKQRAESSDPNIVVSRRVGISASLTIRRDLDAEGRGALRDLVQVEEREPPTNGVVVIESHRLHLDPTGARESALLLQQDLELEWSERSVVMMASAASRNLTRCSIFLFF